MRARSRLGLVHNERRVARRFRFTHRPVPRYFSIQKVLRPDRVQVQVEQESGQVCVGTVDLAIGQARTVRFLLIANRPFFFIVSLRLEKYRSIFRYLLSFDYRSFYCL